MRNKQKPGLIPLFIIVVANYLAQIPYDIHQYHGRVNLIGTSVLFLTLIWFLLGYTLLRKHKKIGYWLLLSFLLVQSLFYFINEVVLSLYGYGMLHHYIHTTDWILWMVFFIGDVNFIASCCYSYYLIKRNNRSYTS